MLSNHNNQSKSSKLVLSLEIHVTNKSEKTFESFSKVICKLKKLSRRSVNVTPFLQSAHWRATLLSNFEAVCR
jgi:hypothetical protein